jgi:hypothetical protein
VWLAICGPDDVAGRWAVAELRRSGLAIELVEPSDVVREARLVHRVDGAGAQVELVTRTGLSLRGDELRGVLNRLTGVPPDSVDGLAAADRDYVAEEQAAAVASWLAGLPCPVLNRPLPGMLCGRWYRPARWRRLAAAVGLPAADWQLSTLEPWLEPVAARWTTTVIGDEVIASPAAALEGACRELVGRAGLGLAGLSFGATDDGWRLLDVTPLPDLRAGGQAAVRALAAALGGGR